MLQVERSFDNVACFFDIVAGVDGALARLLALQHALCAMKTLNYY